MIDEREPRLIETRGQHGLGQRETDGVGHALPERTGCRLHTHGMPVFGMAGRLGTQLPEPHEILFRQPVSEQMQQRIQEHRAVAGA